MSLRESPGQGLASEGRGRRADEVEGIHLTAAITARLPASGNPAA